MSNPVHKSRRKNSFKYKDQSHLLSLSSMKLNQKRDKQAYAMYTMREKTSKSKKKDDLYDTSVHPDEICDKVRESIQGALLDDSFIYAVIKKAREERDINPYKEFEKFLCYLREYI